MSLEHQGFIVNHIKTMNPLPVFDLVIEWWNHGYQN